MTTPLLYEFRKPRVHTERGQQHLGFQVWKAGKYYGYVDLHSHRTKDESFSLGLTVRGPTKVRP